MTEEFLVQDLANFKLPPNFRGRSAAVVQVWWIVQATLFAMSPQFSYGWRNFLLRAFGAKIGRGVIIRPSAKITYPWKLEIGNHSWIGDRVELYTLGPIKIGSSTCISTDTYVCAGAHDRNSPTFDISGPKINIGDEIWIAAGCFIGPGVTVHDRSAIGARSLVLHDIPHDAFACGSPCRIVGPRKSVQLTFAESQVHRL